MWTGNLSCYLLAPLWHWLRGQWDWGYPRQWLSTLGVLAKSVLLDEDFVSKRWLWLQDSQMPGQDLLRTAPQDEALCNQSFLHSPFTDFRSSLWSEGSPCLLLLFLPLHSHLSISCMSNPSWCLTPEGPELTQGVTAQSRKMEDGSCSFMLESCFAWSIYKAVPEPGHPCLNCRNFPFSCYTFNEKKNFLMF